MAGEMAAAGLRQRRVALVWIMARPASMLIPVRRNLIPRTFF